VKTKLLYEGDGSAITISKVGNVKLRFQAASLTLTNAAATGNSMVNAEKVTIEGDAIENSAGSPTSFGIDIQQSSFIE